MSVSYLNLPTTTLSRVYRLESWCAEMIAPIMHASVSADSTDAIELPADAAAEVASFRRLSLSCGSASASALYARGPICRISYDLAYDYRKFIAKSTYDSDLERAEISLRNIVS